MTPASTATDTAVQTGGTSATDAAATDTSVLRNLETPTTPGLDGDDRPGQIDLPEPGEENLANVDVGLDSLVVVPEPTLSERRIIRHEDPVLREQCSMMVELLGVFHEKSAKLLEELGIPQRYTRAQELTDKERLLVRAQEEVSKIVYSLDVGFVGGFPQYLRIAEDVPRHYEEAMTVDLDAIWEDRSRYVVVPGPEFGYANPMKLAKYLLDTTSTIKGCTRCEKQWLLAQELLFDLASALDKYNPDLSDKARARALDTYRLPTLTKEYLEGLRLRTLPGM